MKNMGTIVKYLIYAVTMCCIAGIMEYLHATQGRNAGNAENVFVVKPPSILNGLGIGIIGFGLVLLIVFGISRARGNSTATKGHIVLSMAVMLLGLVLIAAGVSWKVTVENGRMDIYKLLGRNISCSISEIDKAVTGSKGELVIYYQDRKIISVDPLSDHFEELTMVLKEHGKTGA